MMQAMSGLEETGVVDEATWASLIGPELCPIEPQADESGFEPERPSAILPTSPAGSQEWTILFVEEGAPILLCVPLMNMTTYVAILLLLRFWSSP
jgi:hypothetical protein